jgi:hypothetical protein
MNEPAKRLLRLRQMRELRAQRMYEQSSLLVAECKHKEDACKDKLADARSQMAQLLAAFEAIARGAELSGERFAQLNQQRAYLDTLALYFDAELIQAEYHHLEAHDALIEARKGYLLARRERERIERLLDNAIEIESAKENARQEDEAAEASVSK